MSINVYVSLYINYEYINLKYIALKEEYSIKDYI